MRFTMTDPCPRCPFRTDIPPFLTRGRAQEIASSMIRHDQTFQCHQTIDYSECGEDGDGMIEHTANAQHCAGALIVLERMKLPNQMMRIAERIGSYDRRKLNRRAPVFKTMAEFIAAQKDRRNA